MKIVSISFIFSAFFFISPTTYNLVEVEGCSSILWGPLGLVLWPAQSAEAEGGRKRVGGGGRCGYQREPPALLLCAGCFS